MRLDIVTNLKESPWTKCEEVKTISALNNRFSPLMTPAHKAAFLLDPRCTEFSLADEDFEVAVDAIVRLSSLKVDDVMTDLTNYREHDGRFKSKLVWHAISMDRSSSLASLTICSPAS